MQRKDKKNYYLDIAQTVSERGTCMFKNCGAIIVKNDSIIATGYTGSPRGRKNCIDTNMCVRDGDDISDELYEHCRSVPAEANCIINASYSDMIGGTLYLCSVDKASGDIISDTTSSSMCKKLIINAGIDRVIVRTSPTEYKEVIVRDWVFNDDSLEINTKY